MTVYHIIKRNRRMIWVGVVLGYLLAIALLLIRLVDVELRAGEVLGSVALAVAAAIAPTLAVICLDSRPALLPAASLTSILMGRHRADLASGVDPSGIDPGMGPQPATGEERGFQAVVVGPESRLGLESLSARWSCLSSRPLLHPDDGRRDHPGSGSRRPGIRTGWRFGTTGSQGFGGEQTGFEGAVSTARSSDTVVWGEAVAFLLIGLVVIGAALRWPLNTAPAVSGSSVAPNVTA